MPRLSDMIRRGEKAVAPAHPEPPPPLKLEGEAVRLRDLPVLRQIYDELHDFRNHKREVFLAMMLSVAGQSVSIFLLYLLAVALGANTSTWLYFFLLIPVVHLISMLPSLNGLGIREMGYVYFLKNYIGAERAAGLGILWLGLLLLCSVIGGIIYLVCHDYHVQFKKLNPEGPIP